MVIIQNLSRIMVMLMIIGCCFLLELSESFIAVTNVNVPRISRLSIEGKFVDSLEIFKINNENMTVANILDIFSSTLPSDSGSDCSDCRLDGSGLVRLRDFEYNHVESLDEFVVPDIGAWRTAIPMKGIPLNIALVDDANVSPMPIMSFLYDQTLSPAHECKVSELWGMIKTRGSIRKFTPSDVKTVKLAIRVAYVAFWGRKTFRSLEILINRAKGTAAVLGELRAEPDVVVAGLLHDIFSDVTSDEIMTEMKERLIHLFGKDVIALVESYTRLPNFMARKTHYTHIQSENQIQMLVASAEDYRALYIRIADRLHSMRVLRTLPLDPEERIKIAQEARNVYASLAHKMGLIKFKGELEDLALSILEPNMFKLSKQIQLKAVKAFYQGAEEIQETLDNDPYLNSQNVKYNYKKRVKDKYQIVMKMLRKGLQDMNELKDILGVRIIVDCPRFPAETDQEYTQRTIDVCYHVVSVVERLSGWQPRGFKDFIKNSKTNGYASLHLFMWNLAYKTFCEVQVRTRQMHMQAELGEAAHFYYKDRMYRPEIANSKYYRVAWRSSEQIVAKTSAEMIGLAKRQLNAQRVFVFLEDEATVLNLRRGATALDAAFSIHTDIGLKTSSIRVQGEPAPFQRVLKTGDVVSVTLSPVGSVATPSWLGMMRLPHSQAVLRKHLREKQRSMIAVLGCVQLLITFVANKDAIHKRFYGGFPTLTQLSKCCPRADVEDLAELLLHLGISASHENAATISKLLDIPIEELSVFSMTGALLWARKQSQIGWNDVYDRLEVLSPLLMQILDGCGIPGVNQRWLEFVGANDNGTSRMGPDVYRGEDMGSTLMRFNFKGAKISRATEGGFRGRTHLRSETALAQKPFSLEAASMSSPLQRLAKERVAQFLVNRLPDCVDSYQEQETNSKRDDADFPMTGHK